MPISSSLSIPQRFWNGPFQRPRKSYSTRNLSLMTRWKCKVTILVCKTLETFVLYDFVCVSMSRSIVSHDAHKKPWSKIGELVNQFEPYPHVNLPLRPYFFDSKKNRTPKIPWQNLRNIIVPMNFIYVVGKLYL